MGRKPVDRRKVSITRRIDPDLWDEVLEFTDSFPLRVTDTAVIEAALREYLDRHATKTNKETKQ